MLDRILSVLALIAACGSSDAALLGRAPLTPGGADYQAYYDDVLNITWLADANYAATEDFGYAGNSFEFAPSGTMSFDVAVGSLYPYVLQAGAWLGQLNASQLLGISTWRLPHGLQPDSSCSYTIGEGSAGFGCLGGELGYMYYMNLGGVAGTLLSLSHNSTYGNITNIQNGAYFYGDPRPLGGGTGGNVWTLSMSVGRQDLTCAHCFGWVWPVADGDLLSTVVPIPAAAWLLGSALGLLAFARKNAP
jgi:hypothetical protein